MNNKELLYKKLNALRLEVDSSIVDDIKSTVDALFLPQNLQQTACYAALELLEQMLIEEQTLMNDKSLFFYQQGKHYEQARVLEDVIQAIKERQANAV